MGFAMLLALPAMLFVGTLLDVASSDDAPAADGPDHDTSSSHGDLLDDEGTGL